MTPYEFNDAAYESDQFEANRLDAEADEHRDDVCPECVVGSPSCPFCCEGRDEDHDEIEAIHRKQARVIRRNAGMR